jgi:cell division inhibitor SepF
MGLGDVWHRTLVYFGIAEEYDDGWDESYESDELALSSQTEPVYAERSSTNVRKLPRRRGDPGEFDDWTTADPKEDGANSTARSRPKAVPPAPGSVAQVHLVLPRSFNDAKQIADRLKQATPVIVNLQDADQDLSKRLIDFSSGLTYAINGHMQRIAERVFLLTPPNVEVSAEERAKALERGGFFNQA